MLTTVEVWLMWIVIGVCVSIASWVFPFRRGVTGLLAGAAAAIAGALIAGALTVSSMAGSPDARSVSFVAAAAGAVIANVIAHLAWSRVARHRTRANTGA